MKKIFTIIVVSLLSYASFAQTWKQLDSISEPRNRSGAFAINGVGYVVAGGNSWYLSDAFAYDTLTNTWSSITSYPCDTDDGVVGFTINGIGYMGTGAFCCYQYGNEFFKYDPTVGVGGTWTRLAPFPGQGRSFAVAFTLDGKGYIGGGLNGYNSNPLNDFYCYNPATNKWDTIAPCPAAGVSFRAVAFTVGDKAYVGTGGKLNSSLQTVPQKDFWEYDTTSKSWTQVADFGGGLRQMAFGYGTCDKGYVGTGSADSLQQSLKNDFWQYDPGSNTWTQLADFGGTPRVSTSCFAMGQTGYVCCGVQSSNTLRGDLWKYTPSFIPAFSADSSVCTGQSVTFTDTSNFSPDHWLWTFNGGTPGTDTTQNPTVVYNTSGSFDVTLSAWNSCDSGSKIFTQYITVNSSAPVNVLPAYPQICSGQSVTLVAQGYKTYQWVGTTDTTDSITVSPTKDTSYELMASNGTCTKDTFIEVHTGGILAVNIQPQSQTICAGQSINLKVSGGYTYNWSPSTGLNASTGDSVIATPSASVTYTVTAMDTLGCTGTGVDTVTVVPVPNTPTISQHGDTLVSSASTDNQWYLNGAAITGATGQDLIIGNSTGVYTVAVENPADGCTSNSIPDTTAGINQLSVISNQLSIYPNPTNSIISINISSTVSNIGDWNLRLTDVLGQTIYTRNSLNYHNEIDLSTLAAGVYFITVTNKTGEGVFKVIKQ